MQYNTQKKKKPKEKTKEYIPNKLQPKNSKLTTKQKNQKLKKKINNNINIIV